MNIFAAIKKKWEKWYYGDFEEEPEEWDEDAPRKSEHYLGDADSRTVYVLEALGQMAEAADKADQSRAEYEAVTSLLMDMEQIEKLSNDVKVQIADLADQIAKREKARRELFLKTGNMKEKRLLLMERYEEEIPAGIGKIRDAEKYRKLILRDLKKLEAERHSYRYQLREANITIANTRGIALICVGAMLVSIILLAALQLGYEMDVIWGYLMICAAGALTLTVLFVRYADAGREKKRLEKTRNHMITLHNTVKIRYVNNTKLLSYLYMKYDVESADELEDYWNTYTAEVKARQKDQELKQELEYYYNSLTDVLSRHSVEDPEIWIKQTPALVDPREMVEVRHGLIARRQKLREQLEYNEGVARKAQDKIKELARAYPQYSDEIADIVDRYESKG